VVSQEEPPVVVPDCWSVLDIEGSLLACAGLPMDDLT
jgi:hypothetical protein